MDKSDDISLLAAALAKAQSEVGNATKGSVNPFLLNKQTNLGGRYADLGSVLEVAKPALVANGLSVLTIPSGGGDGYAGIMTTLLHVSGQFISTEYRIPLAKQDAQAFGGCLTYARRYSVSAWLNMWAEDDDGNAASATPPKAEPAKPLSPAAATPTGRTAKQLIEGLLNAPSLAALDSLIPETAPYRDSPEWASIAAAGKSSRDRLTKGNK